MAFSTSSKSGPQADINVTPLVDVVLVLLIIFMVVTPLLQVGLDAQIPKDDDSDTHTPPPDLQQVVVSLRADGSIWLNTTKVDEEQLGEKVSALMKGRARADKVAFLSGTDNLAFGKVVGIMDVLKGAGADQVGIIDPLPQ